MTPSSATTSTNPTAVEGPALPWVLRLWVVVLVFTAITGFRSWQLGVPPRDPGGEFLATRIAISLAVGLGLAMVDAIRRTAPRPRTPRTVLATIRDRWDRRRLGLVAAGLGAYHATYFCYHQLKSWNAFRPIHDDALGALDVRVFGDSPARLLHEMLGVGVADRALVTIYESFPVLVAVAFLAPLVLADRMRQAYVAMAAFVWVWILGVGCYYLIPSLGPFHQDPLSFAALPDDVVRRTQTTYLAERADLLAHPHAHDAVAQIGAFASLHVGVTCVILLVARDFGLRRTTWLLAAYLVATCVATVYLGWHFVSDDVAGMVIAVLAFALARRTISPRSVPRQGPPSAVEVVRLTAG